MNLAEDIPAANKQARQIARTGGKEAAKVMASVEAKRVVRKSFRCIIINPGATAEQLCTGIHVNVPPGLTRTQAVDYVTGRIAKELSRYAAWEALGFGATDPKMDWDEVVT